ncbi:hypothetical protein RhiirA5_432383 [Rhizophagus irregularis]|uniref:Uncharacterized protein n=1 Tax=Rhizophagus irregularis TaxID=588596 RepID=A0A2N0NPT1_9GLOM|nr:hypothetical protein RhiirA5_434601 [Rhizophagus irregularis]PKB97498.1 hypothetical protein RhiirA5_433043 [Rhizophagus irregularis]PKB97865.1 hypothetical protein RhiirA5_432383 [Rhizophagus irregularis]
MPSKISTIVTYMIPTKDLHKNIRLKRLRLCQGWTTKIIYSKIKKIKAFIPSDKNIETQIEDFEKGGRDMFKEEICSLRKMINATSIKVIDGIQCLSVMLVGITTKTVRNVNGSSVLEFYVEENLGDREPGSFGLKLITIQTLDIFRIKPISINQNMKSTTAIIVGLIQYKPPVIDDTTQEEITAGKHVVKLEDISLVSTNRNNTNGQSLNLPWMNAQSTGERSRTST